MQQVYGSCHFAVEPVQNSVLSRLCCCCYQPTTTTTTNDDDDDDDDDDDNETTKYTSADDDIGILYIFLSNPFVMLFNAALRSTGQKNKKIKLQMTEKPEGLRLWISLSFMFWISAIQALALCSFSVCGFDLLTRHAVVTFFRIHSHKA